MPDYWTMYVVLHLGEEMICLMSSWDMADLAMEKDRAKREAIIDAMAEEELREMLKSLLHTMNRWSDGEEHCI